jgi:hypothetical protein
MKSISNVGLKDVTAVYNGQEGDLWVEPCCRRRVLPPPELVTSVRRAFQSACKRRVCEDDDGKQRRGRHLGRHDDAEHSHAGKGPSRIRLARSRHGHADRRSSFSVG